MSRRLEKWYLLGPRVEEVSGRALDKLIAAAEKIVEAAEAANQEHARERDALDRTCDA
jgi:hypothetical protein